MQRDDVQSLRLDPVLSVPRARARIRLFRSCAAVLALGVLGSRAAGAQVVQTCAVPVGAGPWSRPDTWAPCGQGVPVAGSSPTICAGATVLLNTSPPPLGTLTIDGTLLWKNVDGLTLEAQAIHVRSGGVLRIGCEIAPFMHERATIRLRSPDCADPEATGIFVEDGGRIELHGRPRSHGWVELAQTADANQPVLSLASAVDWPVGAQVAIASSDFDASHAEVGTIAAVAGTSVTLAANLTRPHFAGDVGVPPYTVSERAEVGLLGRNILVEGTPVTCTGLPPDDRYGGHLTLHRSSPLAPTPVAKLSWVELRHLGNEGQLGDYPLHFHQIGSMSQSYVRSCSIHHCFNRALALHDSQDLEVTGCVAFDSIGHMLYMEESAVPDPGLVTGCNWSGNLVFGTRAATPGNELLATDLLPGPGDPGNGPSSFWIENLDNVVVENHAAGSDGQGFWLSLPDGPFSAGFPQSFAGNVAHSNRNNGFFLDGRPVLELDPLADPPFVADIVAWKNRHYGVWMRAYGAMVLEGIRVADNLGGVYLASAGDPVSIPDPTVQLLRNSVVLGESLQNLGSHLATDPDYTALEQSLSPPRSLPFDVAWCQSGPPFEQPPLAPLLGVAVYDGMIAVEDTHFDAFERFPFTDCGLLLHREAAAFAPDNAPSNWAVDPRDFARDCTFGSRVERVAYMKDVVSGQDGIANTVLFDVEGDLLDAWRSLPAGLPIACPNTGPAYLFPDNPFLLPVAGMSTACPEPSLNGHVWSPGPGECFAQLDVVDLTSVAPPAPPTHVRYSRSVFSTSPPPPTIDFLAVDAPASFLRNFATNAPLALQPRRNFFLVSWEDPTLTDPLAVDVPVRLRFSVHYARLGSVVYFAVPYDFGSSTPVVSSDPMGSQPISEVASASQLLAAPQDAWWRSLAAPALGHGSSWQLPHALVGKIVVDPGSPDAISAVVGDPGVADFFDAVTADFYIQ